MRSMPPFSLEHSSATYGAHLHNLRSYDLQRKIFTPTYYLLPLTSYLLPLTSYNTMKKETIKFIIQLIISILTAIATTLGVTSCLT